MWGLRALFGVGSGKREFSRALLDVVEGRAGNPAAVELAVTAPKARDLAVTAFPIHIDRNRMKGILARDITLQKDAQRRRETFVSIASHELRTPLTVVMGYSQMLTERSVPEATRKEWLRLILIECRRLTGIIDDLLDVSRIQAGRVNIAVEEVPVSAVLDRAIASIRTMTNKHSFVVDIAPGIRAVRADGDKLQQVLVNLLSNAVKYSPKGGRVTVRAYESLTGTLPNTSS